MAKEKKEDIVFNKLKGLNLNIESNIEDIKPEPRVKKKSNNDNQSKVATIKTSFKIEKDLHLALKQYSIMHGKDMADIVFVDVLKPFLEREGFYPPRKK